MRSLSGLMLLFAGIGVAVFVYLPPPVDSVASRFGPMIDEYKPVSRLAQFSPPIALPAPSPFASRLAGLEITAAAILRVASARETQLNWQTTVASAATTGSTELTPRDADARNKLAENIQQQLRRVGCYWGRIDGSWNAITKDAMKEFTDRVNAILPLDQPDYVQLALVQSQSAEICGACPAGQSLSSSGRCMAMALRIASTQKEVLPWMANAVPETPVAVRLFKPLQTSPMPDRMALGAPVPISVDGQQPAPPFTSEAVVTPPWTVTSTVTSALDSNQPLVKPLVTAAPKAKRHSRSGSYGRNRRLADAEPSQSTRKPQHVRAGTPRYNLLLSLGGVY